MKKDTHPEYHKKAKVICSCGNTFEVGGTLKEVNVEICSECHPFFTGQEKIVDTAGRVEKFKARQAAASKSKPKKKKKTKKKQKKS